MQFWCAYEDDSKGWAHHVMESPCAYYVPFKIARRDTAKSNQQQQPRVGTASLSAWPMGFRQDLHTACIYVNGISRLAAFLLLVARLACNKRPCNCKLVAIDQHMCYTLAECCGSCSRQLYVDVNIRCKSSAGFYSFVMPPKPRPAEEVVKGVTVAAPSAASCQSRSTMSALDDSCCCVS